jgi:hypothetical protein
VPPRDDYLLDLSMDLGASCKTSVAEEPHQRLVEPLELLLQELASPILPNFLDAPCTSLRFKNMAMTITMFVKPTISWAGNSSSMIVPRALAKYFLSVYC